MQSSNSLDRAAAAGSTRIDLATLTPGFGDAVHDSQEVFRLLLDALARPGRIFSIENALPDYDAVSTGVPLAAYASMLALADYSTPVFLQQENRALSDALRFHTGAPLAARAADAVFAYVHDASALPSLEDFSLGSAESPETAATLFVRVESLSAGAPSMWRGPGIQNAHSVAIAGLREGFWAERAALASRFPCGIDCYFVAGGSLVGLPRTTEVEVN